ncbi:YihY/virulence factor BrkB family protein [Haloarchaeobius amylolyticus]|uniref:YihY/virulence factor BrkB family protein n=1 Tax=Haloarchaeobius amylolyticus TaxID=1198296 RepID=UPI002270BEF9|nr:YihY/virulence factor BrkB family protein [Haloarchaeobius amylolyticus]
MGRLSSARSFVDAVVTVVREKNVTFLAGGIAYNAFISMVPLFLFAVFAVTLLAPGTRQEVLALVTENVSATIGGLFEEILSRRADGAAGSSVVGTAVLLWGALKVFRGLDVAFSEIYEVDESESFVDQLRDGLVVLVSLVLSLAAIIVATSAFATFAGTVPYLGLLLPLVLAVGLVVAFLPMYYVFPDADVSVREILPGVGFAAVGWALLQGLFQLYVAVATGDQHVGIFTGILLLLTWFYFSGIVMLVGAVINAVRGGYAPSTSRSTSSTA